MPAPPEMIGTEMPRTIRDWTMTLSERLTWMIDDSNFKVIYSHVYMRYECVYEVPDVIGLHEVMRECISEEVAMGMHLEDFKSMIRDIYNRLKWDAVSKHIQRSYYLSNYFSKYMDGR